MFSNANRTHKCDTGVNNTNFTYLYTINILSRAAMLILVIILSKRKYDNNKKDSDERPESK